MSAPEEPTRPAEPETRPDRRPELRIGDREREQAVAQLGTAFGEGRLELAEYDERVASAYSAKTASDLLDLTADLPVVRPHNQAAPPARGQPADSVRARSAARAPGTEVVARLPGWLRGVWFTYATAVMINLLIWLIVSVSSGGLVYFWPIWVAGPWGVILVFQTLASGWRPGSARR